MVVVKTCLSVLILICDRYMMEVITISGLVMLSVVYTESFYLLPTLIKPLVNMFAWYNVRYVYKHYFITLYSRNSNIFFY